MRKSFVSLLMNAVACGVSMGVDLSKDTVNYVVGTSHLDTQWEWTIDSTIAKFIPSTLRENFELFKRYPGYIFSFEGAYRYMLAKRYYPSAYDSLKTIYIPRGNWRVAGSMVDACDVNIPSPESLVRQILYGNGFFNEEFGKKSVDIFLPDCFGFGYALPTIAAHCGLKGFSTQKLEWGSAYGIPFDICRWKGVDGSELVAVLNAGNYTKCWSDRFGSSSAPGARLQMHIGYTYCGVGDRGGAKDTGCIGSLMQRINGNDTKRIQTFSSGSDQLFRDLNPAQIASLPVYNGELVMSTHGTGCYTSRADVKIRNYRNERSAYAGEAAAVLAEWATAGRYVYPKAGLKSAWIRFLWHQFHDDLTGTSIPEAYVITRRDQDSSIAEFESLQNHAIKNLAGQLDTRMPGPRSIPVVVFNPLAFARSDIAEVSVTFSAPTPSARIFDESGAELPSQVVGAKGKTLRIAFLADVPSVGACTFEARPSANACTLSRGLSASKTMIENSAYRVAIDANGDIACIFDKSNSNSQLLKSPARLELRTDSSTEWPQWEVMWNDVKSVPVAYVDGSPEITVIESGPARVSVEVRRTKLGSTFKQTYRLMCDSSGTGLEVLNTIDWRSRGYLLKASFPLIASNPQATFDLGVGTISRPTMTDKLYEVPAQNWVDLTDTSAKFGATILSDYKRGWDKADNSTLHLTLIHSPVSTRYGCEGDQFRHTFSYGIAGHSGDWRKGPSPLLAARFNQPLVAIAGSSHEGRLGKSFSFVTANGPIVLLALKRAEATDEYIIRVCEILGRTSEKISCMFGANLISAREVDGQEDVKGTVSFIGRTLNFSLSPYQPRAFAVRLARAHPESAPIK